MLIFSVVYSIEYLDLTGCISWLQALYWKGEGETGIEWHSQWVRLSSLHVHSGLGLRPESEIMDVAQYVKAIKEQENLERALRSVRLRIRGTYITTDKNAGSEVER
jgi:hypothetical protein